MATRLVLVSFALSIALLALACKPEPTSAPPEDVVPPEQENPDMAVVPPDPPVPPEPIECARSEDYGPIVVSASQYATRYAATASKFSAVQSTTEQPAEVCGIAAGVELLVALTCDDGRNPFGGDRQAAHSSRAGNVGPGGRCGSIIDRYVVPCPEGTFDIYIDSYICADAAVF